MYKTTAIKVGQQLTVPANKVWIFLQAEASLFDQPRTDDLDVILSLISEMDGNVITKNSNFFQSIEFGTNKFSNGAHYWEGPLYLTEGSGFSIPAGSANQSAIFTYLELDN